MTLLKPIHKMSMLTPYEQLFIHTFHHNGNLITEQGRGEQNPLFQLPWTQYLRHRSVQFPHHNQTISNSPTMEADSSNGVYNHHYLTELIEFSAEINIMSHTIVILTYF